MELAHGLDLHLDLCHQSLSQGLDQSPSHFVLIPDLQGTMFLQQHILHLRSPLYCIFSFPYIMSSISMYVYPSPPYLQIQIGLLQYPHPQLLWAFGLLRMDQTMPCNSTSTSL